MHALRYNYILLFLKYLISIQGIPFEVVLYVIDTPKFVEEWVHRIYDFTLGCHSCFACRSCFHIMLIIL